MGLFSRGLIFEWFFCQQIIGLIFEGAYNRGGLYSRFYGMYLDIHSPTFTVLDNRICALYYQAMKQVDA